MRDLPRLRFANLPTPIEELPRISKNFGNVRLWVKRDDLTGLALGGNKTRKLEFLVAQAKLNGADTLVTAGAIQSNHCRQTAAAATRFGFNCILVLTAPSDPADYYSPKQMPSGNLLLDRIFGARVIWAEQNNRNEVLQQVVQQAIEEGRKPYLIPYGGSNPVGASAYVIAMQELVSQYSLTTQDRLPDWIVFPTSSGGTQAGMVLGAKLSGYSGKILGISVDETEEKMKIRVADLGNETAQFLEENVAFQSEEILVNDDYLGGGYGVVGEFEKEAIKLFAQLEGLLLDPVYTGRAAAGLIDLIRNDFFRDKSIAHPNVLFWHTGGTPALFAQRYRDLF